MDTINVPQRKILARIHLADGRELRGVFYAPAAGPDGAPGRLIDQLNRESERFLPVTSDDLLHTATARRVCMGLRGVPHGPLVGPRLRSPWPPRWRTG